MANLWWPQQRSFRANEKQGWFTVAFFCRFYVCAHMRVCVCESSPFKTLTLLEFPGLMGLGYTTWSLSSLWGKEAMNKY